ncbi:MAG: tRNA pseudouridine(38-40) synthase TruA, partial [bacterium]
MMVNIMGIVEYDGSNYYGWQKQKDVRTVQGELENALSLILRRKIKLIGASRTDRWVSAKAQVFNFRLDKKINLTELKRKLNSFLPEAINIRSLRYVVDEFDARKSARMKLYEYRIITRKSPLLRRVSWQVNLREKKISETITILNELACLVTGKHNFRAFSKCEQEKEKTECTIFDAQWKRSKDGFLFIIKGDYFLRGMVRAIVGAMISVAKGKLQKEQFLEMLEKGEKIYNYKFAP